MTPILIVLTLLLVKHYLADFVLQRPYHYLNKGNYGHWGGIQHAAIHGLGTFICIVGYTDPATALHLAFADFVIHYHVDWAKVRIGHRYGLTQQQPQYWWLFGLDQLLHCLTYVWIVFIIST